MTNSFHTLRARVVHGNHLGRTLGYPTANLDQPAGTDGSIPDGVYAVRVFNDGKQYNGMANIGLRPTVAGDKRAIEVHLFNFSGDLYDKTLEVHFVHRIRDEQKFASLDLLVAQLKKDESEALTLLR